MLKEYKFSCVTLSNSILWNIESLVSVFHAIENTVDNTISVTYARYMMVASWLVGR